MAASTSITTELHRLIKKCDTDLTDNKVIIYFPIDHLCPSVFSNVPYNTPHTNSINAIRENICDHILTRVVEKQLYLMCKPEDININNC